MSLLAFPYTALLQWVKGDPGMRSLQTPHPIVVPIVVADKRRDPPIVVAKWPSSS